MPQDESPYETVKHQQEKKGCLGMVLFHIFVVLALFITVISVIYIAVRVDQVDRVSDSMCNMDRGGVH